jgi:hypothetical protein
MAEAQWSQSNRASQGCREPPVARLHLNSAETDVPKRLLVALPAERGQRFAVYCASVVVDFCLIDPWFADIADILV